MCQGFSHFSIFFHDFVLANLATPIIRVKVVYLCPQLSAMNIGRRITAQSRNVRARVDLPLHYRKGCLSIHTALYEVAFFIIAMILLGECARS